MVGSGRGVDACFVRAYLFNPFFFFSNPGRSKVPLGRYREFWMASDQRLFLSMTDLKRKERLKQQIFPTLTCEYLSIRFRGVFALIHSGTRANHLTSKRSPLAFFFMFWRSDPTTDVERKMLHELRELMSVLARSPAIFSGHSRG